MNDGPRTLERRISALHCLRPHRLSVQSSLLHVGYPKWYFEIWIPLAGSYKPADCHSRRSFFPVTFRTFHRQLPVILWEEGEGGAQQSYLILTVVSYLEYEQIPELIQTLDIIKIIIPRKSNIHKLQFITKVHFTKIGFNCL